MEISAHAYQEEEQNQGEAVEQPQAAAVEEEIDHVPSSLPAQIASIDLKDVHIRLKGDRAKQRYQNLLQKQFENTRFLDKRVLVHLGIREDFYRLTSSIGIQPRFWDIRAEAFTALTMEFLCSFELVHKNGEWQMDFRVNGKKLYCTESQLSDMFGLDQGTIESDLYEGKLWEELTLEKNTPVNQRRSSHIQHITLRFIQRMFSLSIFSKGESGVKVAKNELALLNQMLHPKGDAKLNLPWYMMKHFEAQANNLRAGKGQITIGGYVSYLVQHYDLDLPGMRRTGGPNRLNMARLIEMKMVEKVGNGYQFSCGGYRFPLPFNKKIDINNKRTWLLVDRNGALINHEQEELQQAIAAMEAAARAGGAGPSHEAPGDQGAHSEPQQQ